MLGLPSLGAIEQKSVVQIPNGISLPRVEAHDPVDPETAEFLAAHSPVIGAIGRLSPEKGLADLLEAFVNLRTDVSHAGLLLVGEGRQRQELADRARQLGVEAEVHFAGFRSPAYSYMAHCTVIAMPSHTEGLPITLLEAMALGVPVVATAVGAIPSVLGDGEFGELATPKDPGALLAALKRVLGDRAAAIERAVRGRERVKSNYSAAGMASRYAEVYAAVAQPKRGSSPTPKVHFMMDFLANPNAGTEGQAIKLMTQLLKCGWEVDASFFVSSPFLEGGSLRVPYSVLGIRRMAAPLTWYRLLRHAARLRRQGVRVVHIFFNDASLIAPPVLKLFGLRVIISRRDMGFWYTDRLKRLLRISGRFVDRAVCNSEAVRSITADAEGIPEERLQVIHNGYEHSASALEPAPRRPNPVVGIVANLRPIKRIDDLLRAFSEVLRKQPDAELQVIGAGDPEPLRRLAAELGITQAVHFLGSRPDAVRLVQAFDVGVLCSESEGMSNAIIEYLQAGKPVVCTRTGGNPEIVADGVNGYLVEVGDVSTMADRICRLLADPTQARRMGEAGAERVRAQFSTKAMVSSYEALYRLMGAA
jgi:glycosyltransferase involved in cell wall biosynthesis